MTLPIERTEVITDLKALRAKAQKVSKWAGDRLGHKLVKFIAFKGLSCYGLAAPQIGINKRVFVLFDGKEFAIFINPRVISTGPIEEDGVEACLSIPGKSYKVKRPTSIIVKDAVRITPFELTGLTARVWLHELGHLNGVLISDIGIGEEVQGVESKPI